MSGARLGGPSSVFPVIRVRYSHDSGNYHAAARWSTYRARATRNGYNVESEGLTPSQAAVEAAWLAHVRLAEKVHAPRPGEDREWWAEQLARKVDRSRFVAVVLDGDDVGTGGYLVSFMDADSVRVVS